MTNLTNLQNRIPLDSVCLIENEKNLRYLLEFNIDTGYILATHENAYFITDFRYIETAENHLKNSKVSVILQNDLKQDIKDVLEKEQKKNLLIETAYQTISKFEFLKKITENISVENTLDKIIVDLRITKNEYEIAQIEKAQKITDDAFSHILPFIKEGVSEKELALELEFFMRKNGAEGVSFDLITISDKNTSLPHGVPSYKKIQKGEFITMDIGCKVNGYCSDMTRTVALGEPTDEMKKVYNTVLLAQKEAFKRIKSGVKTSEVDFAARDFINKSGYEDCFGHATGLGVGLDIHEEPRVSTKSDTILQSGMIITVEPGIYLQDKFGVRIEDMVMVTDEGCYNFTKSNKELIIL